MQVDFKTQLENATAHLEKHDPTMALLIQKFGPCQLMPHDNYYQELVESIIGQQLSVKAARTIRERFVAMFGGEFPMPEAITAKTVDGLREVGLSRAKAVYVQDLAEHVLDGRLEINKLPEMSNDEIVRELTAVKGIGEWTAHMFLMFSLGRLDVLAVGDLGVRAGIQKLYDLPTLPDAAGVRKVATDNGWHPYETMACWYVWQSLDNAPL